MSNDRRIIFNTRERLLSGDFNNGTSLVHAKSADELVAAMSGFLYQSNSPISGLMAGGVVTANGANMVVTVSPMIGFKYTPTPSGFDSNYQKVQSLTPIDVDLAPFVDATNPRWVAIHAAPGDVVELAEVRDIFDPTLGTFTPQLVDKIRRPEPTITVSLGAPSLTPVLPLGTSGVIPLAYVYIQASASAILVTDVVLCRPLLSPRINIPTVIRGGGVNVAAPGGTIVSCDTTVYMRPLTGVQLTVTGAPVDADEAGDPRWFAGQGYPAPGSQLPVYVYAIMAPYPPGYDVDVTRNREFSDPSGRIPSNASQVVVNGLLVFSVNPPSINAVGTPSGAPFSLNDSTWNGGSTETIVFVGAVSKQDAGTPGFAQQTTRGAQVVFQEQDKLCEDSSTQVSSSIVAAAGSARNQSPLLLDNESKGLLTVLRQAYHWSLVVEYENIGPGDGFAVVRSTEDISSGPPDRGTWFHESEGAAEYRHRTTVDLSTPLSGAFEYSHSETLGGGTRFRVIVRGYTDPNIALR